MQEKILIYRAMEARLGGLVNQRDMLVNKIMELQSTLNSVDELKKSGGEVVFPIGSEAYKVARAIEKDRLIVEVGANIALEKTTEEGKIILGKRKKELENFINQVQQEIAKVSNAISQLQPEIQEMANKLQQAG